MKRRDNASKIATLLAVVNTVDHYLITRLLFPYCVHAKVASVMSNSLQPMDCSPPDSSVHGILQARTLEWVATLSSRGSSQPRDQTHISCGSCIAGRFFTTEPLGKPYLHITNLNSQGNYLFTITSESKTFHGYIASL